MVSKSAKTPGTKEVENSEPVNGEQDQKAKSKLAKKNLGKSENVSPGETKSKEGKTASPRLTSSPRKFSLVSSMMKMSPRIPISGTNDPPDGGKHDDDNDDEL